MLTLNTNHLLTKFDFKPYKNEVKRIHTMINDKSGPGGEFLGWVNWPKDYDKTDYKNIKKWAKYVRENYEVLVCAGIGGSYLGIRAAIEAIKGLMSKDGFEVIYLGQTLSSDYTYQVLEYLKTKKFAINAISKQGTTTESAIAFRLLLHLAKEKYGEENLDKAVFITTDKKEGLLKDIAIQKKYPLFDLPTDIGGRYSVFTAVGLFPLACAGLDIDKLMEGAATAMKDLNNGDIFSNKAYQYAAIRDYFYRNGKKVEMFVTYEPQYLQLGEWLKQLFGESEGKEGLGLLPVLATFSTDLHSIGQFIQEGSKILFETIIYARKSTYEIPLPHDDEDLDELNYLEGKKLSFVNEQALLGTLKAHTKDGGVPNIIIELDKMDEYNLGYLYYFYMKVCAMSAYLLGVNPFDQPGVDVYKKNMFHLLGKKGY